MKISWTPPTPRTGLTGEWDKFIGPETALSELAMVLLPSLQAATAVPLLAKAQIID